LQPEFLNDLDELIYLVRFRFLSTWLQAERARDLRMRIYVMAAADAAQCEPERLDKPAEFGKADVPGVAGGNAIPQPLSPRTRHGLAKDRPKTTYYWLAAALGNRLRRAILSDTAWFAEPRHGHRPAQ
jgi:hypothetical protein